MPPMVTGRSLVLHADDYGMNAAVNAGILRAFREGLLTSTSLLANAPAADEACVAWPQLMSDLHAGSIASASRRNCLADDLKPFDLGIHLNLTQGRPLSKTYPADLLNDRGQFPGIGVVFRRLRSVGSRFRDAVQTELQLQIERMLDWRVPPTHLNGHQYVELMPGVAELIPGLMERYSIPTLRVAFEPGLAKTVLSQRRVGDFVVGLVKRHYAKRFRRQPFLVQRPTPSRFFGTCHAGLVDLQTLKRFLSLAGHKGCTEIGLHPAEASCADARPLSDEWFDPLAALRPNELAWLCDATTGDLIASCGLRLGRLSDVK